LPFDTGRGSSGAHLVCPEGGVQEEFVEFMSGELVAPIKGVQAAVARSAAERPEKMVTKLTPRSEMAISTSRRLIPAARRLGMVFGI